MFELEENFLVVVFLIGSTTERKCIQYLNAGCDNTESWSLKCIVAAATAATAAAAVAVAAVVVVVAVAVAVAVAVER